MSDLQGETSETEQSTSESQRRFDKTTLWNATIAGCSVAYIAWKVSQSEAATLQFLHLLLTVCRRLAFYFGTLAIVIEKTYYDYVATLH